MSNKIIFFSYIFLGITLFHVINADFPGLRRPPTNWAQNELDKGDTELLSHIRAIMMEHNARKLMQQLEQLNREKEMYEREYGSESIEQDDEDKSIKKPEDFLLPSLTASSKLKNQFAYGPTEWQYWIPEPNKYSEKQVTQQKVSERQESVPTFNVKEPMLPNPKFHPLYKQQNMMPETDKESKINLSNAKPDVGVVQKKVKLDDEIGIYIVAMIAGVSAAITVAIIIIGLGWYTLRKKIKAAADVDYPAYGVTGPNKDLLYPNEKKIEQSINMLHYQQQKQKKNSLENKSNGETNDGFSDLDGEFDVDEGDYTVYECPGFAPTGEMEVKNPLFADEPITIVQKSQPSTSCDNTPFDAVPSVKTKDQLKQYSPNNNSKNQDDNAQKNISYSKDSSTSMKKK